MLGRSVAVAIIAMMLGGCADRTGVDFVTVSQQLGPPKSGRSRIVLLAEKRTGFAAAVGDVEVDGSPVGKLRPLSPRRRRLAPTIPARSLRPNGRSDSAVIARRISAHGINWRTKERFELPLRSSGDAPEQRARNAGDREEAKLASRRQQVVD